jgi:hypothetical protein
MTGGFGLAGATPRDSARGDRRAARPRHCRWESPRCRRRVKTGPPAPVEYWGLAEAADVSSYALNPVLQQDPTIRPALTAIRRGSPRSSDRHAGLRLLPTGRWRAIRRLARRARRPSVDVRHLLTSGRRCRLGARYRLLRRRHMSHSWRPTRADVSTAAYGYDAPSRIAKTTHGHRRLPVRARPPRRVLAPTQATRD